MDKARQNNGNWMVGGAVIVMLCVLPFILARFGQTGEFWTWVATEMIIMALFATSLNLILGFGGMVSFGHAAFFGVGAYTVALLMKKAGVSLLFALIAAPCAAGIAAAVIGWFCVRFNRALFCYFNTRLRSAAVYGYIPVVHLYRRG